MSTSPRHSAQSPAASAAASPADDPAAAQPALGDLLKTVQRTLTEATDRAAFADRRLSELELRLAEVEATGMDLAHRLESSESQTVRLMNLYVATYQLHATLDPSQVRTTIAEIATNLLGVERLALLLRTEGNQGCNIVFTEALDPVEHALFTTPQYQGGDPLVDACLADGCLRIGPMAGSRVAAAVPLIVQDATVGALVLVQLLHHKAGLGSADRELLDLLGAHAALALFAAQLHSTVDRKLRTLETLVKLARPQ